MGNIEFVILPTDYDIEKIKDGLEAYCDMDPYYASKLAKENPNLIRNYKEVEREKKSLKADILIIEDDIICIIKYFYLIELYIKKFKAPKIGNVLACTKAESVHFVLDKLAHPNNKNPKPKLIILDFDLQEKIDSPKSILNIVNRIERLNWYPEYLAVSGFKSIKGVYEPFETKLRENHHRTYEKERLDDHKLMLDNLEFLLNRTEPFENRESVFNQLSKDGNDKYEKLERVFGKPKVESAIRFLDNLENGIKSSCQKQEKLNAEIHKVKNMRGSNYYNRVTLAQQISDRKEIINELIQLSHSTSFLLNRWEYFEYQVCHHRFSKHLKCPKLKNPVMPQEKNIQN